ncbi:hypothetical protein ACFE04_023761 [Oxalis oulophora]
MQPPPCSLINTTFLHPTVATLTTLHRRTRSETTTTDNSLSPCYSPTAATTPDDTTLGLRHDDSIGVRNNEEGFEVPDDLHLPESQEEERNVFEDGGEDMF